MSMHKIRRLTWGACISAVSVALVLVSALPATADSTQHVSGTNAEGLWLHTSPGLSTELVTVLPEGAALTATCFSYSDTVSSPISDANPIWLHVLSDAGEGWVADAYVDTTWSSVDDLVAVGIPACDDATAASVPSAPQEPQVPDSIVHYEGDSIPLVDGFYPLAQTLLDHYLYGRGRAVVPDAGYFTSTPGFEEAVKAMPVGGFGNWSSDLSTDLFVAVGTFTISRETDNCWAAYDHYDFTPDKKSNYAYVGLWAAQLGGAQNFDVHASGCFE